MPHLNVLFLHDIKKLGVKDQSKKLSMKLSTPSARNIFHGTWLNFAIVLIGDLIWQQ